MQADELCVNAQGGKKVWVATAMSVFSRLFLWGEVSTRRDKPLIERVMAKVRTAGRIETDLFWTGSVYNFCTIHASLNATPAMAAGLAEHVWSVEELLRLRLPEKPLHGGG